MCYASELDRARRIAAVKRNPEDATLWSALTKHDRLSLRHLREAIKGEMIEYHLLLGWVPAAHSSHGIKWVEAGVQPPSKGTEITSDNVTSMLAQTLELRGSSSLQFTVDEWEKLLQKVDGGGAVRGGVSSSLSQSHVRAVSAPVSLSIESYIKLGDKFYRPQPLPPPRTGSHMDTIEGRPSGALGGEEADKRASPRSMAQASGEASARGSPMLAREDSMSRGSILPKKNRRHLQHYFSSIDEDAEAGGGEGAGLGKWDVNGKLFKRNADMRKPAAVPSEESSSVPSLSRVPSDVTFADGDGGERRGNWSKSPAQAGSRGWLEEKLVRTKLWKATASGVVGKGPGDRASTPRLNAKAVDLDAGAEVGKCKRCPMPSALCVQRNKPIPAHKMTQLSYRQVLAVLAPDAAHVMHHILSKANKSTSQSFFRDSCVRQGPDNFDVLPAAHARSSASLDLHASAEPLLPSGPLERNTSPHRVVAAREGARAAEAGTGTRKEAKKEFEWTSERAGGKGQRTDAPDELLLRTLLHVQQVSACIALAQSEAFSLSLSLSLSHTHTLSLSLSLSHYHSLSLCHSLSLSSFTHTHNLSLSLSLSVSLCLTPASPPPPPLSRVCVCECVRACMHAGRA